MTNKEAIEELKKVDTLDMPARLCEAHYMAIKALEQEPKTGHWIVHPKGIYAHLVCDRCLSNAPYDCCTNYCPNCGARMESEE